MVVTEKIFLDKLSLEERLKERILFKWSNFRMGNEMLVCKRVFPFGKKEKVKRWQSLTPKQARIEVLKLIKEILNEIKPFFTKEEIERIRTAISLEISDDNTIELDKTILKKLSEVSK